EGRKGLLGGGLVGGIAAEADPHALIAGREMEIDARIAGAAPRAVVLFGLARKMPALGRIELAVDALNRLRPGLCHWKDGHRKRKANQSEHGKTPVANPNLGRHG